MYIWTLIWEFGQISFPLICYIVWKINNFPSGNIQAVLSVIMSVQTSFPAYQEISIVWMSEKHGVSVVSWSIVLQGVQRGWFLLASFHNSWVLWGWSGLQEHAKWNCSRCPNGNAWELAVMPSPYMLNIHFLQLPSTHAQPAHKICFRSFTRIRTICVPARFNLVLKCGGWVWGYQQ